MYIQIILILSFIDVQYLPNIAFSFEKDLNDQNHSSLDTPPPNNPKQFLSPLPRNTIWKTLINVVYFLLQQVCVETACSRIWNQSSRQFNEMSKILPAGVVGAIKTDIPEFFSLSDSFD